MVKTKCGQLFLQSAKSRTMFYFEYIGSVPLLLPYQRPECCFKSKLFSCLDRDTTIFVDFQGPRPRRDIGIARPRHSKTCLETETRLETSSCGVQFTRVCASPLSTISAHPGPCLNTRVHPLLLL